MPDTFCKSIAQKWYLLFSMSLSLFPLSLLLNCLAAWRNLSEISLKLQYLPLQVELIKFRRIIRKLYFPFALPNVDIGINSNWLQSVPQLHWKFLTRVMHLTQALKECAKGKGSLDPLWKIRSHRKKIHLSLMA